MVSNNRDVNYLHSLQDFMTLQRKKYLILGQISCQNCHNPNNICIINSNKHDLKL